MNNQRLAELESKNKNGEITQAEMQELIEYTRLLHEAAADRLAHDYEQAWAAVMRGNTKCDKN